MPKGLQAGRESLGKQQSREFGSAFCMRCSIFMKRSSAQAVSSGSADTRGWSGKSSLLEDTRASPNQTCQVWVFQRSDHCDLTRQTMASGEKDRISRFLTSMVFWKTATQHPEGTELFLFTACPHHIGFVDGRPVAQQHAFDWVPITVTRAMLFVSGCSQEASWRRGTTKLTRGTCCTCCVVSPSAPLAHATHPCCGRERRRRGSLSGSLTNAASAPRKGEKWCCVAGRCSSELVVEHFLITRSSRAALPATARQSLMRLWREAPPPAGPCWTPLQAEGVHDAAT